MLNFKKIFEQFNISAQCKRYGISFWQHPQMLFLIMGVIIAIIITGIYLIGVYYLIDPITVVLAIILLTAFLFIISFIVTNSFERLVEVNRMKTEFIGIISHQLRSPFTNLKWVIEILTSGQPDKVKKKQLEYFQILKENNNRIGRMINDLLVVSRIEEKRLYFKKSEFFLEDLIKDLILEFKSIVQPLDIEIQFLNSQIPEKISTDFFQIKTVIEHLLDNAIRYVSARSYCLKASKKEKGKIKITTGKRDKNFYFEIKDNGVGIPAEDQKYIFQKFFRSVNILKYQTQGTGLGLFIVKYIIKNLGGEIGFKSEEWEGSTFWFTLPIFIHSPKFFKKTLVGKK